jgi:hypothetical protein
MPQYMLLIHLDPAAAPATGSPEQLRAREEYTALTQQMQDEGSFVAGGQLQPAETATTVRVNGGGEAVLSDGPFAETKEWLAGYYLLDCPDLDAAAALAARIPAARHGSVEVRPVMDRPVG